MPDKFINQSQLAGAAAVACSHLLGSISSFTTPENINGQNNYSDRRNHNGYGKLMKAAVCHICEIVYFCAVSVETEIRNSDIFIGGVINWSRII